MADIRDENVSYPSNGTTATGYLARPEGDAGPGVVVVQEWWGLDDHIRDVARRLAAAGYLALAPDLYHGQVAREPDEAQKLRMGLDLDRAVREIASAARYLKTQAPLEPARVGVVGWCMGGALAYRAGWASDEFAAVVAFYGRPPEDEEIARIQAPVLGLFADQDRGIPPEQARRLEEGLRRQGMAHEVVVYAGAGHAFFNDTRAAYHPEHAGDAWRRTLEWFDRYLR